jgi:hypothetical protein
MTKGIGIALLMLGMVVVSTIVLLGVFGYYGSELYCFNTGCSSTKYWYQGSMKNLSYVKIEYRKPDNTMYGDYYTDVDCNTIASSIKCYETLDKKVSTVRTKYPALGSLMILNIPLVIGIATFSNSKKSWIFWAILVGVLTILCLIITVMGAIGVLQNTRDICSASCKNTTRMLDNGQQVNTFEVTITTNYITKTGSLAQPKGFYYSDTCPVTVDCYYLNDKASLDYVPNLDWLWMILLLIAGIMGICCLIGVCIKFNRQLNN